MATFLYNFSIVTIEKKLEKEDMLKSFCDILSLRIEMD